MTCKHCKGRGETRQSWMEFEGEVAGEYVKCAPCRGTGEALCECGTLADGISPLGDPACVTCLAVPLMAADAKVLG